MLKVSPWKGVVRFGKQGKLNPRYVGPFKVLEKVRAVAYKLKLPQELSRVHNMFHVSILKKCYADEPLAVLLDGLHIDDKLQFVEEPVEIMDHFAVSDSEHSTVTYISISSDDGSSDVGSPGVIVLGYDGLPMMPEDPYAYVEAAIQEPPPPNFVLEPVYQEFMPPEDDVLLAEEQPLLDLEDDDEDLEEDPADYPTDKDNDKEEEESSKDDANDEEDDEGVDEEEEEHLAHADSTVVAFPAVDHDPSAKETELFETNESAATPPPHPAYRVMARMSIRP
ncbi:hypothetical protein Tco_0855849 [Tanacetum coccineum]